ncbi:MAG TPA: alpha/beta hydrolase [Phycisphaerae bacterium]|nr:alpha/beta hydrolase [Phycisphaerae bacterium]
MKLSSQPSPASFAVATASAIFLIAGCSQNTGSGLNQSPNSFSSHGDIYYLDGAGGGGVISNWGYGVKEGMKMAGFNGKFVEPHWETGMGVFADQVASDAYKRQKAGDCAAMIRKARAAYPDAPITLMGLSAGTAVAVFTLEALPPGCQVDNVVLLGASIGDDYDLCKALQHVSGRMYVFTSENDAVLNFAVPVAGTADRQAGTIPSAGLNGFTLPAGASPKTCRMYAKITNIAWRTSFENDGDWGGHTDTTHPRFVRDFIAPLVLQTGPQYMHPNRLAPSQRAVS